MHWLRTRIAGLLVAAPERLEDERGFFARTWCRAEAHAAGAPELDMVQSSVSFNLRAGTLRGMHFATRPAQEAKLVRCTRGALHDVILDLRPDSPSYLRHQAFHLDPVNRLALLIPPGCAHGFQTLQDETEAFYQMSESFLPNTGRGVRWDDPAFAIRWPDATRIIHARDAAYPDFDPALTEPLRGLLWPATAGAGLPEYQDK